MRERLLFAAVAFGLLLLATNGQVRVARSTPVVASHLAGKEGVSKELEALNAASRKLYAGGRALELSNIPAVIIVSGDDLILRMHDKRTVAKVIPAEYHALKCVAHATLALFAHLAHEPGKPIGEERLKALKEYRELLVAAKPAIETFGFDLETLTRQKLLIARALEFIDKVLKDGQVTSEALTAYCRKSRLDVMANCGAAARAQLLATHRQVMAWKKDMTPEEWASLTVIVQGAQTPRVENAAVQYFARLFGEKGECRRIAYAESLWDEEKALNLLGTLRLDGKLSVAVFDDRYRMYRDIMADVARAALDEIFAVP